MYEMSCSLKDAKSVGDGRISKKVSPLCAFMPDQPKFTD